MGTSFPARTCVGCKAKKRKGQLYRFVALGGKLVLDIKQRYQTRGAWSCKEETCVQKGIQKRVWNRALSVSVGLGDLENILNQVQKAKALECERELLHKENGV